LEQSFLEMEQLPDEPRQQLKRYQAQVDEDIKKLYLELLSLESSNLVVVQIDAGRNIDMGSLLRMCDYIAPMLEEIDRWLEQFVELRKKHILLIQTLFPKHSGQELKEKKIILFCKSIGFDAILKVLPQILFYKDLQALNKNKVFPQLINGDWHLAPLPLVDYENLTGYEDILHQKPVQKKEEVIAVEPRQRASSFELFKIRHGEKTRKFLNTLYAMGFLRSPSKRGHLKLKNEQGQEVIIPLDEHLKKGTSKGVEKQVAEGKKK
jgi:predicted RNA binding protein YcfA (HicA-like mRNA interferase family)